MKTEETSVFTPDILLTRLVFMVIFLNNLGVHLSDACKTTYFCKNYLAVVEIPNVTRNEWSSTSKIFVYKEKDVMKHAYNNARIKISVK